MRTATARIAPTPPVALPQKASEIAKVFGLHSARKCLSRRRFPIRLREPKGLELKSGTVKVPTRKAVKAKRRKGRLTAIVDRGFPKRRVVVTLKVVLRDGRKATGRRTYHTCVPKKS